MGGDSGPSWSGGYLAVDGAPFPIIGAEVHNSSTSTVAAVRASFETVRRLGATTVLAPVAWDLFEPVEGRFDTTLLDAMIERARADGLRLIPLWFGTWKNASSSYAPAWVKKDPLRFPRSHLADGTPLEHLTPFGEESRNADARAFAALLRRIAEVDEAGTVIAVQVQNEVGLLGESRDRSPLADRLFAQDVPRNVVTAIAAESEGPLRDAWVSAGSRETGTWDEVLPPGDVADEAFMATAFASYVQAVAGAGRAELDIPLFVNAWLDEDSVLDGPVAVAGGKRPGQYPSGGPVIRNAALWEALAPALDLLAPDMYVADAAPVFAAYRARRGRLLIPELRADTVGIAQMFQALGEYHAAGVSPFGVDALDPDEPESAELIDAYRLLNVVGAGISKHPEARVHGFALDAEHRSVTIDLADAQLTISALSDSGDGSRGHPGYGILIEEPDGESLVLGRGFSISVGAPAPQRAAVLSATVLDIEDGALVPVLRLNGDETGAGTALTFPSVGTGLLGDRPIPTRLPDTGIARLSFYTF